MIEAAAYSAVETLRDGRSVTIRALKPEDRSAMLSAVGRVSAQSLYRRFFGPKRRFTEKETDFFVNVDFVKHVALVASLDESGRTTIIGGGRYIVTQPETAELAFATASWDGAASTSRADRSGERAPATGRGGATGKCSDAGVISQVRVHLRQEGRRRGCAFDIEPVNVKRQFFASEKATKRRMRNAKIRS